MSWLSDALHGDFSWIGGKNTLEQLLGGLALAGGGVGLAGLAGLGPAAGLLGAGAETAGAAGGLGAVTPAADLLAGGSTIAGGGAADLAGPAAGALSTTAEGLPFVTADAASLGAPGLATTIYPAAGAGVGAAEVAGGGLGLGGLGAALGNILGPSSAAAAEAPALTPNQIVGGGFDAVNKGIQAGEIQPTGTMPNEFLAPSAPPVPMPAASPLAGGASSAAGFAGPAASDITNIAGGATAAPGDVLGVVGPGMEAASGTASGPGIGSGIMGFLKSNPGLAATLGLGAAGTLLSPKLSSAVNKVPNQGALTDVAGQAQQLSQQQQQLGTTLTNPLVTGHLPPQAQQVVSNAVNDAVSTTKARYANLGLSGSTMEADAIANIQNQSTGLTFQIAQQMAATGQQATATAANALGLQDQVYTHLMQAQIQQDSALQQAIASFAGAAALGQGIGAAQKATA